MRLDEALATRRAAFVPSPRSLRLRRALSPDPHAQFTGPRLIASYGSVLRHLLSRS